LCITFVTKPSLVQTNTLFTLSFSKDHNINIPIPSSD
jgi:hypothetical protein